MVSHRLGSFDWLEKSSNNGYFEHQTDFMFNMALFLKYTKKSMWEGDILIQIF